MSLVGAGCASSSDTEASGTAGPAEGSTASSETTTSTTDTSTTETTETAVADNDVIRTGQAGAFRALVGEVDDLQPDVRTFFDNASDARIEELATQACSEINSDMTTTELGLVAITAMGDLTDEESDLLDLTEFSVAFGTLAGFYCPDRLPIDTLAEEGVFDPEPADNTETDGELDPSALGGIDGYRTAIGEFLDPTHQGVAFIDSLSDDRLFELQDSGCGLTNVDMTNTELGLAVFQHYSELSDAEQSLISVEAYAELYGTMLAWFCPVNLPAN